MGSTLGYPWVWRGSHSNGAGRSMDLLWHRRSSGLCLERSDPHHSQVEPPETLSEFLLRLQSPHLPGYHRRREGNLENPSPPCFPPIHDASPSSLIYPKTHDSVYLPRCSAGHTVTRCETAGFARPGASVDLGVQAAEDRVRARPEHTTFAVAGSS